MLRLSAIVTKEWAETLRNRLLLVTVFLLPTVFLIAPLGVLYAIGTGPVDPRDVAHFVELSPRLAGLTPSEVMQVVIVNQFLFFFLMMPSVIPMTVAAFSIIGEKQARSLEPLLATPVSTEEVLLGKAVAAIVPALVVTWVAYGLFVAVSYFLTSPPVWRAILNPRWLLAMAVIAPLLSVLSVLIGMAISSRVNDTRVAQQLGGLLVLPIVGMAVAQTAGVFLFSVATFAEAALAFTALDVVVFALGVRLFQRDRILTRWK